MSLRVDLRFITCFGRPSWKPRESRGCWSLKLHQKGRNGEKGRGAKTYHAIPGGGERTTECPSWTEEQNKWRQDRWTLTSSLDTLVGTSVDAFVGCFVEGKSTLVGAVVGALVGALMGPLVSPFVGPRLGPLAGQTSLSPALCVARLHDNLWRGSRASGLVWLASISSKGNDRASPNEGGGGHIIGLGWPTRKPRHASVFSTHSDTQAVPAFHCIRMFKGIFSTRALLKRTDTLSTIV